MPGRPSLRWNTGSGVARVGTERALLGVAIPAYAGKEGGILFASTGEMNGQINAVVDAGIDWFRTDVVVQQGSPGALGVYDFSAWEATFAYAKLKGIKILACMTGQVTADGAAPSQPTTSTARQHVADFAVAFVNHFDSVDALEVGNEFNTERFWPSPSAAANGALLAAVYPAVKAVRPALPVIAGGTGGVQHVNDIRTDSWYTQLYAGGYNQYFDAAAVHAYSNFTTIPGLGEEQWALAVRATMDANGDAAKELWSTESGVPTGGTGGVSEADQATIIGNSWAFFRSNIRVRGPWFLYTLEDFAASGSNAEDFFGIRHYDYTHKPSYSTVQALPRR